MELLTFNVSNEINCANFQFSFKYLMVLVAPQKQVLLCANFPKFSLKSRKNFIHSAKKFLLK